MTERDWVRAACLLGYCGVMDMGGFGTVTVGECEEFFAKSCFAIDQRLGEPAGCRWFLNAWDETPRPEMIAQMLLEVERAISLRNVSVSIKV